MYILAHRGMWENAQERNSIDAIEKAMVNGFGFETDFRDYCGKLVISHDIASDNVSLAEDVFSLMSKYKDHYTIAINIKSDGLSLLLAELLNRYNIRNYFVFDMSIPQMVEFNEGGFRFFTRQSEIENPPVMYKESSGLWLDGFFGTDWIDEELIRKYQADGKSICIVSPELHHRDDYLDFWKKLNSFDVDFSDIMLCTDYPDKAKGFFNERNKC